MVFDPIFKLILNMKMMCYSVNDTGTLGKKSLVTLFLALFLLWKETVQAESGSTTVHGSCILNLAPNL